MPRPSTPEEKEAARKLLDWNKIERIIEQINQLEAERDD